jgi:transposase
MSEIEKIRRKFELLGPMMNEKMSRLWVACEAHVIGPDGVNIVAIATGISKTDIRTGLQELEQSKQYPSLFNPKRRPQQGRIRRPGGGRKLVETKDPSILTMIEHILENEIAGDPMSEKKWMRSSTKKISNRLKKVGYHVSSQTVSRLLKDLGFSMKANKKRQIRDNNPDRDQQFKYIAQQRQAFSDAGLPIISVDAKKKELIGNFSNKGKTWCKEAEEVNQNDYPSESVYRAVPYGIYDVTKNTGYVFVGTSNNTPEFAVDVISRWWEIEGSVEYPNKNQICILADGGGSNGWRSRAWKKNLQNEISDKQGLIVTVCHYPTGCAKWNPIEHRLFSYISINWAGKPLRTLDIMLGYIRGTTTTTGLTVKAIIQEGFYKKGQRVTNEEMEQLNLQPHSTLPDWNYTICPQ